MKRKIILAIIFLFSLGKMYAQSPGEIRGTVFDKNTNKTIPGASVFVEIGGNKVGTATDIDGNFLIKPLNAGTYNLNVTFVGYQTNIIAGVKVDADKATKIDEIFLANKAVDFGKEVIITDYKDKLINPRDPFEKTITPVQTKGLADSKNLPSIIGAYFSDVKVNENDNEIYFRGSRSGDAMYIVDGIKQINGGLNVPSTGIGSFTVYTGGVPAKYGDFLGGVVVIETMSYFDWLNQYEARQYSKTN